MRKVVPGWIDDALDDLQDEDGGFGFGGGEGRASAVLPPRVATVMTVGLSADARRVVDEATAGTFLRALERYIADPQAMLL